MNNRLKFRAWSEEYRRMYKPSRNLLVDSYDGTAMWDFSYQGVSPLGAILMQCTGLKDSAGVDIYEGDIVRFSYGIPPVGVKAPIEYHDGAYFAMTPNHVPKKCPIGKLGEYVGEFWVDGNIYENPELLEAASASGNQ